MEFEWEYLPDDVLIRFLSELELPDLANYCKLNQRTRDICELSSFWRQKISREFPNFNLENIPLPGMTIRETYFKLIRSKVEIPVYINSITTQFNTIMGSPYYGWDRYISELMPLVRSTTYLIIFRKDEKILGVYASDNNNKRFIVLSDLGLPDKIYILDPEGQNYYYPSLKGPLDKILNTEDPKVIEDIINGMIKFILDTETWLETQRKFREAIFKLR